MSENGKPNGIALWRTLAIALASALATGVGSYLLIGRDVISRVELEKARVEMNENLAQRSPYTADKPFILKALEDNREAVGKLIEEMAKVGRDQSSINTKLDILLQERTGRPPARKD